MRIGMNISTVGDVHTLDDAVLQAESITGFKAKEIYVDRGYRGHNYRGDAGRD